jgi:uncharacterized glyoxalase superfamily protein PhnB
LYSANVFWFSQKKEIMMSTEKDVYLVASKQGSDITLVARVSDRNKAYEIHWEILQTGADCVMGLENSNWGRQWKNTPEYKRLLKKSVG